MKELNRTQNLLSFVIVLDISQVAINYFTTEVPIV